MNKRSIIAFVLVAIMLICNTAWVQAEDSTITISSKEDFLKFSKNCTLDTFSQGKTVNLVCDIDISGIDFSPIPTFGGTFNGNGYTISGINLTKSGSNLGLFRYIQEGGEVINLTVKGNFLPGGSKSFIGGIAGENSGVIESCSFDGKIAGENVIGGIAGKNTDHGQIISCHSFGNIIGENSSGGIVGKNEGLILNSINDSQINTVYEGKKRDITDINADAGAIVETYKTEKDENEEESILGHTDTGGVAGYNSGILQGCTNNADIGYPHVGYNVGGIVGRQSGYLLGCNNYGFIQGRKDVGGIVGQMEPYIMLDVSEQSLKNIRQELSNLHAMVNRFISDTDSLGSDIDIHLNRLSDQSKTARDNSEILLDQGTDFVDDNLSEINAQTAVISNTIDKLDTVFESLSNGASNASNAVNEMANALDSIQISAPKLRTNIDELKSALDSLSDAESSLSKASVRARRSLNNLENGVRTKNDNELSRAISDLSTALKDMTTSKNNIKKSVGDIENILKTTPESFEAIGANTQAILENLKIIKENTDGSISSFKTISDSLDTIILNTKIDFSSFQSAAQNMESALAYLTDSMDTITKSLKKINSSLNDTLDELYDYTSDTSNQLKEAKDKLSVALSSLSYATDDIKTAMDDTKRIISDLSDEKNLEFVKLGDDFKDASDSLFNSLADISDEIGKLRNTASNGRETLTGNIKAISNQFNIVMNILVGEMEQLQNFNDVSDIFLDVSDEDIENTKQGKVAECQNFGIIEADRNTGGIVGSLAIEYAKDPEDEIEKPDTLNFTYRTKAILQSCINDGNVVGKKDCVGGIVGLSEIGTVYECENYGNIESTGGNYIGGICGKSESGLRKCYTKGSCTGTRYVGGIAGKATSLTSCYSISTVNGDEAVGAVLGDCNELEKIYQNFFLDKGIGAIDGISYSQSAEPISFESLSNITTIPRRMISFTITFIADDEVVKTQEIKYGEDTARIRYPEIPEKEGQFGNWQIPDVKTVTEDIDIFCEYQPYITILSSEEKNESGKLVLALAEGKFTDKAKLSISENNKDTYSKAFGNVKVYDITLTNTAIKDGEAVTLRLLNENKDNVKAWILNNGSWEQIKASKRGKYVIVNTTGTSNTICLQYTKESFNFLWLIPILLIIGIMVLIIMKRKHNSMNRQKIDFV